MLIQGRETDLIVCRAKKVAHSEGVGWLEFSQQIRSFVVFRAVFPIYLAGKLIHSLTLC